MIMLIFVFVIAGFLGVELIAKVPSQLHTPLMSGTNAISGITIVGAITVTALNIEGPVGTALGFLAIVFANLMQGVDAYIKHISVPIDELNGLLLFAIYIYFL